MTGTPRHLVIDGLNLTRGGGVVVMERLARAFKAAGYEVTVLTARELPGVDLEQHGIRCLVRKEASGAVRASLFRRFQLSALVKRIGGDALLGFNYFSPVTIPQATYHINVIPFLDFPARRAAVGLGRAVMQNRMAVAALRKSTINLFESEHVRDLASATVQRIHNPVVAHIGVKFTAHTAASAANRLTGPFITVTSGARHKRNDLTVSFFRKLLMKDPLARLEVVGDPEAIRAGLSVDDCRFLDECGLARFRGYIAHDELFALLSQARGLVTFSELESFFMVGIEAMAVGCPVIGADNSSIRESLGDAGLLVPSGDVDSAVEAALGLDTAGDFERLGVESRAWASRFDAERCAAEFVEKFERGIPAVARREHDHEDVFK
ncbi:MAG: glycosyltransferase family 4 protein [Alphaproteobacteria bacterium]|nr:glycosyltransferase family 4 protein [Alphaproteobacteria bacterium]